MSVKNLYTLMAKEVQTDAADNMNSIIKIIDKFIFELNRSANLNLIPPGVEIGKDQITVGAVYSIATSWLFSKLLEKETFYNFKCTIVDPDGVKMGGPEQEHLIPKAIDKYNLNFNVQGLPITKSGEYKLIVELQSKSGTGLASGEYPFKVEIK
jgi:hypothetical protein